jgi:hypothetical protein
MASFLWRKAKQVAAPCSAIDRAVSMRAVSMNLFLAKVGYGPPDNVLITHIDTYIHTGSVVRPKFLPYIARRALAKINVSEVADDYLAWYDPAFKQYITDDGIHRIDDAVLKTHR